MIPLLVADFITLAHSIYTDRPIPLHRPVFAGPEREWLVECIDSNFVSSVGARAAAFPAAVEYVGVLDGDRLLRVS